MHEGNEESHETLLHFFKKAWNMSNCESHETLSQRQQTPARKKKQAVKPVKQQEKALQQNVFIVVFIANG